MFPTFPLIEVDEFIKLRCVCLIGILPHSNCGGDLEIFPQDRYLLVIDSRTIDESLVADQPCSEIGYSSCCQ